MATIERKDRIGESTGVTGQNIVRAVDVTDEASGPNAERAIIIDYWQDEAGNRGAKLNRCYPGEGGGAYMECGQYLKDGEPIGGIFANFCKEIGTTAAKMIATIRREVPSDWL